MSFVICIPTYRRYELIKQKSLKMLRDNGIPDCQITVYVADEDEKTKYVETLGDEYKIVVGILGLNPQREFIKNQYPEGQCILFIDDDIESIDLSMTELADNVTEFVEHAFQKCQDNNAFMWGIYPVLNPFYRQNRREITTDLKFIVGCFYGIVNRPNCEDLRVYAKNKEDTERSIIYYIKDEIVLRFDRIAVKTKLYNKIGGVGDFKSRLESSAMDCLYLSTFYPEYGKSWTRKSGMSEFRLRQKK